MTWKRKVTLGKYIISAKLLSKLCLRLELVYLGTFFRTLNEGEKYFLITFFFSQANTGKFYLNQQFWAWNRSLLSYLR